MPSEGLSESKQNIIRLGGNSNVIQLTTSLLRSSTLCQG